MAEKKSKGEVPGRAPEPAQAPEQAPGDEALELDDAAVKNVVGGVTQPAITLQRRLVPSTGRTVASECSCHGQ